MGEVIGLILILVLAGWALSSYYWARACEELVSRLRNNPEAGLEAKFKPKPKGYKKPVTVVLSQDRQKEEAKRKSELLPHPVTK